MPLGVVFRVRGSGRRDQEPLVALPRCGDREGIEAQVEVNCEMEPSESWGTAVAQWLRCCATNRKVAGSTPAGVIGIFH